MIAITQEPGLIVLVIGIVAIVLSAIAIVGGSAKDSRPVPRRVAPSAAMTSAAVLARASAAARQHAASGATVGCTLDAVRPARPDGQEQPVPDGDGRSRADDRAKAASIALHIAQHDPQRMAEVIREWIRTDPGLNSSGNR